MRLDYLLILLLAALLAVSTNARDQPIVIGCKQDVEGQVL